MQNSIHDVKAERFFVVLADEETRYDIQNRGSFSARTDTRAHRALAAPWRSGTHY
jgi:hypothetical protein